MADTAETHAPTMAGTDACSTHVVLLEQSLCMERQWRLPPNAKRKCAYRQTKYQNMLTINCRLKADAATSRYDIPFFVQQSAAWKMSWKVRSLVCPAQEFLCRFAWHGEAQTSESDGSKSSKGADVFEIVFVEIRIAEPQFGSNQAPSNSPQVACASAVCMPLIALWARWSTCVTSSLDFLQASFGFFIVYWAAD